MINPIKVPEILLPNENINMREWAVIACDQFTSDRKYWEDLDKSVADSPSALRLVLPEAYLNDEDVDDRIEKINANIKNYLNNDSLFRQIKGFVYVERKISNNSIRKGIVAAVDLEHYSFKHEDKSLIRATESTVIERIPPRLKIRKDAQIELPHILVFMDDIKNTIFNKLSENKDEFEKLYDFDLITSDHNIKGYLVNDELENTILDLLNAQCDKDNFMSKYDVSEDEPVIGFAMGDGNHSLATAKTHWENIKKNEGVTDHPARYALVEIVNIHDEGLQFYPIHRIVESDDSNKVINDLAELISKDSDVEITDNKDNEDDCQYIKFVSNDSTGYIKINNPCHSLTSGTMQKYINIMLKEGNIEVDYIHGDEELLELTKKAGNVGFFMDTLPKDKLFVSVIENGVLPRKAFSMGESIDKRYYIESRIIADRSKD